MKNNKLQIGDFEYKLNEDNERIEQIDYVGAIGVGSVARLPEAHYVKYDDNTFYFSVKDLLDCIKNKDIEKLIVLSDYFNCFKDLQFIKEIEIECEFNSDLTIRNCASLEIIRVKDGIRSPKKISDCNKIVKVIYNKGINDLEKELVSEGTHIIFGNNVETVGTIMGGHITLGTSVKEIYALKKAEFNKSQYTYFPEYELPTRIDFEGEIPPEVRKIQPGAMSQIEIHVNASALQNFLHHPQWGKAGCFIDSSGNIIDNYKIKFKERIKKNIKREKEKINKAKKEKLNSLSLIMHKGLLQKKLEKWSPFDIEENKTCISFKIILDRLQIGISFPIESSAEEWDKIKSKLEFLEIKFNNKDEDKC